MERFRASLFAHPRAAQESLEVYGGEKLRARKRAIADVAAQTPAVLHRGPKPDDTTLLAANTDKGPRVSYVKGTTEGIKLPILIDSGSSVSWHICMVYLDDILIYSSIFDEHLTHLKEVFSRICSAGLKLNPRKCNLARDHVVFLGHVVSEKGLQPDPRNTEKVRNWPVPQSPSEVRAFVGLCSNY